MSSEEPISLLEKISLNEEMVTPSPASENQPNVKCAAADVPVEDNDQQITLERNSVTPSENSPQVKTDATFTSGKDSDLKSVTEDIDNHLPVDPVLIEKLAEAFCKRFLPPLEQAQASLGGVLNNQEIQIETLQQENAKFRDCAAMIELAEMMAKAKKYHSKLITLRKEMNTLHEKSTKLKRRALKIQQQRHKEDIQRAQQLERELEHERMLSATVARTSDPPT